jgi:hypothetical protein
MTTTQQPTSAELITYTEGMSKASAKRFINNAKVGKVTDHAELQRLADHERSVGRPPRKGR